MHILKLLQTLNVFIQHVLVHVYHFQRQYSAIS